MTIKHPELTTVRDFIRYATSRFHQEGLYFGHGTDNAWDEASTLILHTLSLPHHIPATALDAHLIQSERVRLLDLINQRIEKRIPVPYLTHEAWFASLPFYVDERVLIPRSPLAELIENQFSTWINLEKTHRVLDLCTGSGCIAIACAKALPSVQVDASDISEAALAVAKINVLRHHVEDQVHLHQADLFHPLPPQKYDIIISNPPYVDQADMATLPDEYRHEPQIGLMAGELGLDFATKILADAAPFLNPHGILIVEVGNSEQALSEKYPKVPFTWLEFERGGGGVFLLTAEEVHAHKASFQT